MTFSRNSSGGEVTWGCDSSQADGTVNGSDRSTGERSGDLKGLWGVARGGLGDSVAGTRMRLSSESTTGVSLPAALSPCTYSLCNTHHPRPQPPVNTPTVVPPSCLFLSAIS
jgi:hypothetical protein